MNTDQRLVIAIIAINGGNTFLATSLSVDGQLFMEDMSKVLHAGQDWCDHAHCTDLETRSISRCL